MTDFENAPRRRFKLAQEDGREVWLDFETGLVSEVEVPRAADASDDPCNPSMDILIATVSSALDERGYQYMHLDPETVMLTVRNVHSSYGIFVHASDVTNTVRMWSSYGSMIPDERRVAIAETCARINTRIGYGSFEIDFEDGELRFRVGLDVEDGLLSGKMVDNMMGCLLHSMERFHPAVMHVAFGGMAPAVAVADVD